MTLRLVLYLWLGFLAFFIGGYLSYFGYLRRRARGSWGFEIDPKFNPSISILVPAHNEEKLIVSKLENLKEVSYPRDRMEVILIDDASTDQTLLKAQNFLEGNPELHVRIVRQTKRQGKACGLNAALKNCSNGIVVVTDADTFWPPDILHRALPYMVSPAVGAISGMGQAENAGQSWVTNAEKSYMDMMLTWRLGESKVHSTIRFEGCFCAFKREAFEEFDSESGADDSGTALRVIQNGYRAVLVPEARTRSEIPYKAMDMMRAKLRRAVHLTGLWVQCLRLLAGKRLKLPKRIAVPEMFLSLFMPFMFIVLVCLTLLLLVCYPIPFGILFALLGLACLVPRVRSLLVQGILHQLILCYAVILYVYAKKKFVTWER